jgi:hypothetical protein
MHAIDCQRHPSPAEGLLQNHTHRARDSLQGSAVRPRTRLYYAASEPNAGELVQLRKQSMVVVSETKHGMHVNVYLAPQRIVNFAAFCIQNCVELKILLEFHLTVPRIAL